ncbi:MAG: hypothetical protein A3F09_04495 [Chlamydiae bacterium RIFCSPHIGHO2_12_FULL_49_11]|nr:MAG: hypothetical protein A3F09_04495 [Chlamydiae bacterium RIFCSPHIGHO2_12_FULL_49_11]
MVNKLKTPPSKTVSQSLIPIDYSDVLNELKSKIQMAQLKAVASVNSELTSLAEVREGHVDFSEAALQQMS